MENTIYSSSFKTDGAHIVGIKKKGKVEIEWHSDTYNFKHPLFLFFIFKLNIFITTKHTVYNQRFCKSYIVLEHSI